jgi:ATP-dependent Clp protease ATP-binding subunit ClpB
VDIAEPSEAETIAILKNQARLLGVSIKEDALLEIVRLADRLIGNVPEPAKSLSILEELQALHKKITIEDVRQVVSDKTNMPIGDIGADEKKVLLQLEASMRNKIVGQDEAVKDVSEALRRLRTGIADHEKPAGSFLFLGPTGVGKTYTAKILAESYFGRKNAMIRFDMSEFSLNESVTPFTDRLTGAIEEAPLSLVFFDELEKSNVLIRNLLLQVLDEGRLTRASGREASFKDAIIIATTNAGSADIIANPLIDKKLLINNLIQKGIFAPEFLNRFNSIVLFKPLDQTEVRKVASLLLAEFAERLLADKKITLVITDALIDKIASAGFDLDFGARPIKRAMEEIVENKVAEYIMAGNSGGSLKII